MQDSKAVENKTNITTGSKLPVIILKRNNAEALNSRTSLVESPIVRVKIKANQNDLYLEDINIRSSGSNLDNNNKGFPSHSNAKIDALSLESNEDIAINREPLNDPPVLREKYVHKFDQDPMRSELKSAEFNDYDLTTEGMASDDQRRISQEDTYEIPESKIEVHADVSFKHEKKTSNEINYRRNYWDVTNLETDDFKRESNEIFEVAQEERSAEDLESLESKRRNGDALLFDYNDFDNIVGHYEEIGGDERAMYPEYISSPIIKPFGKPLIV